ncbi:MAG: tRNA lysidine(34) synthetase TilS [Spirochaetaceae bacterium]|jgi:tRNA(Ile)-lysidine synthase|nr:tRNA lysidine(34) synthetase TilS [Spirochaetaceae bacterium]
MSRELREFEKRLRLPRGTRFLAAVSGGADSVAMLAALAALRERRSFALYCAHVEHGIRGAESQEDARFVRQLCQKLNTPLDTICLPAGKVAGRAAREGSGIEAAAREERYAALTASAARCGADWILLAHTRDDLLETVLLRLLRGSGPGGLRPMRRRRGGDGTAAGLFRPMLDIERRDVLAYLTQTQTSWREDATNRDIRYTRNRVRHKLIPVLDEYFPAWKKNLHNAARTQALAAAALTHRAAASIVMQPDGGARITGFAALDTLIAEEAVFAAMNLLAPHPAMADTLPPADADRPRKRTVRREALRRWIARGRPADTAAADRADTVGEFGRFVVKRLPNGDVEVHHKKEMCMEEGRTLVLKTKTGIVVLH